MTFAIAQAGFQHGGDAGSAGRQGPRLRVECKRYGDNTALNERELLGELDHAIWRNPALEAWLLVTTRAVPEQLEQSLLKKGEAIGVPVVVIDWKPNALGSLAALCASAPDLVDEIVSREAGALALALQPASGPGVERLKRELQSWSLGFTALRARSIAVLETIWGSERGSNARLGQNAAVGAQPRRVRRDAVHQALSSWWKTEAVKGSPAAIVGFEGVGKTWAALDWLHENRSDLPITLIVPASCAVSLKANSESDLKRFLAARLQELTETSNADHWVHRLENLLKRPVSEGALLTILIDGLNQEPSVPWRQILKALQDETFQGRVRIIFTTRAHHWEDSLRELAGLVTHAVLVKVEVYDANAGGELDKMLEFEGLGRTKLHPDLLELARTPRLFKLVLRFGNRLVKDGRVTVHRLLWEYGRDTLGERAFSESEWRGWLQDVARRHRDGVRHYSFKELSETASRADLEAREVYVRLSDIIDGQFAKRLPNGDLQLSPHIVSHALGAALINHVTAGDTSSIAARLGAWLDPINGMDERAEILRAAVSILLQSGLQEGPLASLLVTAWLQTQNITEEHRRELKSLAADLLTALLATIEDPQSRTHGSAQHWAADALRSIDRKNADALASIVKQTTRWFCIVSRDVDPPGRVSAEFEAHRSARLINQLGVDNSGPLRALGLELLLVDHDDGGLSKIAASLLEGFPLAPAAPIFEAAAITTAIHGGSTDWQGLKWLCLLNEVDPQETATTLRKISSSICSRIPESGVNKDLPARASALVLCLTGEEEDEVSASALTSETEDGPSYQRDYLAKPSRSLFPLERRHASDALTDTDIGLVHRARRTRDLWLEPGFTAPDAFIDELRAYASKLKTDPLHWRSSHTKADWDLEELLPALSRCAPDLLCELSQRKLEALDACPAESRYRTAYRVTEHLLLLTPKARAAATKLRLSSQEDKDGNELYASTQLLLLELVGRLFTTQAVILIESGIRNILLEVCRVLREPTADDADALVSQFASAPRERRRILLLLLAQTTCVSFRPNTYKWLEQIAFGPDEDLARLAYRALANGAPDPFGRLLLARNWQWSAAADPWVNHYGSGALLEATMGIPFEQVAPNLAPWRLLEAARRRGDNPAEVRMASKILGAVLGATVQAPEHGSQLSVDATQDDGGQFRFSVTPIDRTGSNEGVLLTQIVRDEDAEAAAHKSAVDEAIRRIREVQVSGAALYLMAMETDGFAALVACAWKELNSWLAGMDEHTPEFARRVHLAEAAYLSLCEHLLAQMPQLGARLWRALHGALTIQFVGRAGVDELIHIAFRAPECPEVEAIWNDLLSLQHCHTDRALMDLALAAAINGKETWLRRVIQQDKASTLAWKRKRGVVLEGYESGNTLPVEGAWEEGGAQSSYEELRRTAARRRFSDACAQHWWRAYLTCQGPAEAYSAWVLFLHSADRRAWRWMQSDRVAFGPVDALRWEHFQLNQSRLRREFKKQEDRLEQHFLGCRIHETLSPWRSAPP